MTAAATRCLALTLVLLAGCGGGGGGASVSVSGPGVDATVTPGPSSTATPPATGTPSPGNPPLSTTPMAWKVSELATGLNSPWGLAFLPDGKMLLSHRIGQLSLRNADGTAFNGGTNQISGVPAVDTGGQGGLLDVAVDPNFASNRRIYFSFSERDAANANLNSTAVARAELDLGTRSLVNLVVIFRQLPKVASNAHFGSRLVFDRSGFLFVTLGERLSNDQRVFAQDLARGNGKVMRITTDGAPAPGNPFAATAGAQPEIWSYGHRNVQGAALHPATGELWVSEHGPQGGDEINLVLPGRNYGWPVISYGQEYGTLAQVGEGTAKAGMEQPLTWWEKIDGSVWQPGTQKSSIAPSGMAFYTGDALPDWKGNLFVGALAGTALWRIVLTGNTVASRERLLAARGERIRDVRQGPDGWLYVLTDGTSAKLLRLER